MVFQNYNLFPHKTALENVMEGPVIVKGMKKEDARKRAQALLEKVGLGDKIRLLSCSAFRWSAATCWNCQSFSDGAKGDAL